MFSSSLDFSTFTNSNVNITSGHVGMYPVHRIGTDFDINIISPSQQDKIGSGNLLTPDEQTIDDEKETKNKLFV
ncbi:unnamed protein product [Rotaria sp. Silwood2]|nr:unnamed protein product [Rotaria sp. Silwood2]